jgi:uncharacterized protein
VFIGAPSVANQSFTLIVKVIPGASRDRIVGKYGDAIKVQVAAAPERGRANDAVIALFAKTLAIKPSQIQIIAGHTNPRKTLQITGPADVLAAKITDLL